MGFVNVTALELLMHLENRDGKLDYFDMKKLKNEHNKPSHITKHPTHYFNHVEKKMKALQWAGIMLDMTK